MAGSSGSGAKRPGMTDAEYILMLERELERRSAELGAEKDARRRDRQEAGAKIQSQQKIILSLRRSSSRKEKQAAEASRKALEEARKSKALERTASRLASELGKAVSERDRLRSSAKIMNAMLYNVFDTVRCSALAALEEKRSLPGGSAPLQDLCDYLEWLVAELLSTARTFALHRDAALGLGRDESNRRQAPPAQLPADARAEADGLEELSKEAEASAADSDDSDFKELSSEHRTAPARGAAAAGDPAAAISSRLHDSRATSESLLGRAGRIMDECAREAAEDLERMGADYGRRAGPGFITAGASGLVAGVMVPAREYSMRCKRCGRTTRFRLLPGSGRVNEVVSGSGLIGSVGSIMAAARVAECCECGATVEINPASAARFDYVAVAAKAGEMADRLEAAEKHGADAGEAAAAKAPSADAPSSVQPPSSQDPDAVQTPCAEDPSSIQPQSGQDTAAVQPGSSREPDPAQAQAQAPAANEEAKEDQGPGKAAADEPAPAQAPGAGAADPAQPPSGQDPAAVRPGSSGEPDPAQAQSGSGQDARRARLDQQKERRREFSRIASGGGERTEIDLESMLVKDKAGRDAIDPYAFSGVSEAYSMSPAFSKTAMSIGLLASFGTLVTQAGAPKNRAHALYESGGYPFTRAQLVSGVNGLARYLLHPVAEVIHGDILMHSAAVLMDESTLLVREAASRKRKEGGSRKSQIWTLCSGWGADRRAAWFAVRDTRGAENVVEILGDAGRRLEYLVSDGYSGYGSGLEELERRFGIRIKSARCLTHARRPLHRFLDSAGLLKIYRALLPRGSSMADFPSSLEKYCKTPEGARLDGLSRSLLSIYYLINCLFAVDGAVVRRHQYQCQTPEFKADLLKARREKSLPIADALFDAVRLCILGNPGIVETRLCGDGSVRFKALPSKPQGRALIYLLNFEEELRRFIESAEVELSQSAAERSLKLGICSRKSFMYIQSDDGAQAFADFQTIANTCALNRVPLLPYLLWLSASVRLRLLQAQRSGADMEGAYAMPHKQRATGPDGKPRTIGMYSEEAEWGADRISARGLAPYDYRALLESLTPAA